MTRSSRVLALAAMASAMACADPAGPTPPSGPGPVDFRLTIPHAGDGALLITVAGGPVDSVTAAGADVAWLETAHDQVGVLVDGDLRDGAIVRLWVPEREIADAYVATITQVVDGRSYEHRALAGYAITPR